MNSDRPALVGAMLIIAATTLALWFASVHREPVRPAPTVDTLAIVTNILARGELLQCWPSAPTTMIRMARVFDLDPLLLPCIARASNPAPKYRNPYGMTFRGRIVQYDSYTYATYRAAELLAQSRPIWDKGNPSIPALAKVWCPLNADLWTRNMTAVYREAGR